MAHPQLAHNGLIAEVGSAVGPIRAVGSPFLVNGERPNVGSVPALGEHTAEVLDEPG
jgi:itaconate CoA-transferase